MLLNLTDRLIDTCPYEIYGMWALQDPIATVTPELTYTDFDPDALPHSINIALSGTVDFQKPEPVANVGDMARVAGASDKININYSTAISPILLYFGYIPTDAEDTVLHTETYGGSGTPSTEFYLTSSRNRLPNTGDNAPPDGGVVPIVCHKIGPNNFKSEYGNREHSVLDYTSGTKFLINDTNFWVNNVVLLNGSGATVEDVFSWARTITEDRYLSGAPRPEALGLQMSPLAVLGPSYDTPAVPEVARMGYYSIDFVDNVATIVDPDNTGTLCNRVMFTLTDYSTIGSTQSGTFTVNTTTTFPFEYNPSTSQISIDGTAVSVAGQIKVGIDVNLVDNMGVYELEVKVRENGSVLLTKVVALVAQSSQLTQVKLSTGVFKQLRADVFGDYINKDALGDHPMVTTPFKVIMGPSTDYSPGAGAPQPSNEVFAPGRVAKIESFSSYEDVILTGPEEITTGDFCLFQSFTMVRDGSGTGAGKPLVTLGSGATPVELYVNDNGEFKVHNVDTGGVVTVTPTNNLADVRRLFSVAIERVGTVFKLYIDGVEEYTFPTMSGDIGYTSGSNDIRLSSSHTSSRSHSLNQTTLLFQAGKTATEHLDLHKAAIGEAPTNTSTALVGKFQGAVDGEANLVSLTTGQILGTGSINSSSWYNITDSYVGDFMLVCNYANWSGMAACIVTLDGPATLPADVFANNGQAGSNSLTGFSRKGDKPHAGTVYVYRKSDMVHLIRYSAVGGAYTMLTNESTECVIIEVVDGKAAIRLETPA